MLRNFQTFPRLKIFSRNIFTTASKLGEIRELEDFYQFDEEIENKKILVYFYAEWCGPCKFLTKDLGIYFKYDHHLKIFMA